MTAGTTPMPHATHTPTTPHATHPSEGGDNAASRLRRANRRTAVVLVAIALVFFFGIIATRFMENPTMGIGVVSFAIILFLIVAIGRNLRGRQ